MKQKWLDVNYYINWFANEFITYFPGIYEKDELLKIISSRVSGVLCTSKISFDSAGEYLESKKIIKVYNPFDYNVLFHEFTHALRSYYFIVNDPDSDVDIYEVIDGTADIKKKFGLADEGMTEYITKLYAIRKKKNDNNYMFIKLPKQDKYNMYELSAAAHSNINLLTVLLFGHDFIKEYLSGENIYNYVFQIFLKYLNSLDDEKDNEMFALRLANMFVTYLAELGEEYQIEGGYDDALKGYVEIEKFLKNFAYIFGKPSSQGKAIGNFINKSLLFEKPIYSEDVLLSIITGDSCELYNYRDLEKLYIDYVLREDSSKKKLEIL